MLIRGLLRTNLAQRLPWSPYPSSACLSNGSYIDADDQLAAAPDHVELLVNDWLPIRVKSEVKGLSHQQARELIMGARETLHRAVNRALVDYLKRGSREQSKLPRLLKSMLHVLPGLPTRKVTTRDYRETAKDEDPVQKGAMQKLMTTPRPSWPRSTERRPKPSNMSSESPESNPKPFSSRRTEGPKPTDKKSESPERNLQPFSFRRTEGPKPPDRRPESLDSDLNPFRLLLTRFESPKPLGKSSASLDSNLNLFTSVQFESPEPLDRSSASRKRNMKPFSFPVRKP